MAAKDAWTKGYQKTQAEYMAQLKREAKEQQNKKSKK